MNHNTGMTAKAILLGIVLLGLSACASQAPERVDHEGGIVGTGNQLDCSLPANKHKDQCRNRTP